jgi:hypothetical protein
MSEEVVYLSSLDSTRFEPVRECQISEVVVFDTGKVAVVANISPPVIGQDFDRRDDIETVVLAARFEGSSVAPIDEYPCFVFIAVAREGREFLRETPIRRHDLEIIGWGELYRTRNDAVAHRFG